MQKYRILILWGIVIDLLDKILSNTYLVVTSLLIVLILSISKTNNKYSFKQNFIALIIGIIVFVGGILMHFMAVNNTYSLTISAIISFGGGIISYSLLESIKDKNNLMN